VSILGTRVLRTEDPRFLTTGGVYTDDVVDERLVGACHVFFVRSPIAHARIQAIDVSAALSAPGVVAAFTGADLADLPAIKPSPMFNRQMARPVLATDKVRYVGEPVAVVVTEQAYQGEDAMELVDVDYDPTRCSSTRRRAPTWPRPSATPARSTSTCSTSARS
jgi:carbon-monoxide dehydrogenase large subunit